MKNVDARFTCMSSVCYRHRPLVQGKLRTSSVRLRHHIAVVAVRGQRAGRLVPLLPLRVGWHGHSLRLHSVHAGTSFRDFSPLVPRAAPYTMKILIVAHRLIAYAAKKSHIPAPDQQNETLEERKKGSVFGCARKHLLALAEVPSIRMPYHRRPGVCVLSIS